MQIERVSLKELTYDGFMKHFADKKPVILTGGMEDWKSKDWTLDYIDKVYGDRKVTIRKSDIDGVKTFKQIMLSNYIENIDNNPDNWYCDWAFNELGQGDLEETYTPPEIFTRETIRVDEKEQKLKWFFLGSKNTATPLHQDFNSTHAWNAIIFGSKKWVFFSNEDTPYLYNGDIDMFDKEDIEKKSLINKANPIYVTQYPGEIIYAPRDWWHQVVNIEPTLAVSENFWFEKELDTQSELNMGRH
ncbi:cupin-like domain-containing protein [Pontibacillus litoralis]|uniref:Cupin n=1 Tax=Pontibacillus litoralis JSM 072002 TaxID=1385512 RepID=A0A0A5HLT5_9BACI|nr:cupin-like domain-containing protein [Pontibacillus litoralis]KGX84577.1 cupin [Pontibacillus litoralis JSM 072002]